MDIENPQGLGKNPINGENFGITNMGPQGGDK